MSTVSERSTPIGGAAQHPIRVSMVPGSPVIEAGLWAMLKRYAGRVERVPIGSHSEVVVAFVQPGAESVNLPEVNRPVIALVDDDSTARSVSQQGAVPVPFAASGAQLMAIIDAVRSRRRSPSRTLDPTHGPRRTDDLKSPLSSREMEVIKLLCTGRSNKDIAAKLYVSINSVKTYIRSAYRKIGAGSRPQAIIWGIEHGYGNSDGSGIGMSEA